MSDHTLNTIRAKMSERLQGFGWGVICTITVATLGWSFYIMKLSGSGYAVLKLQCNLLGF